MSKAKLDKGDKQLEMAGYFIIDFFKGIVNGIKRITKEKDKLIMFVIVTLISGVIFYFRIQIGQHFAQENDIHVMKIAPFLVPLFPLFFLYYLGTEGAESEDDFAAKFASIKFCGKDGKYPVLKSKTTEGKKVIYSFYSPGINILEWKNSQLNLETVLDCNIAKIENPNNTKQIVKLHVVPADQGIKDNLIWNDSYIRQKDFLLCIGQGLLDDVEIDLNKYPHALIAGVTGSGKSVILRSMLWQCVKKGARIHMIDFKGGVEFGLDYEDFGEVITERQDALDLLKDLTKEMRLRLDLFRKSKVKNLPEYNKLHPNNPLCRILLVCDEIAEMLDKTGLNKNDQVIFYEIEKEISSLARLSRAAGINMLLATQRPDAKVVAGQIKNNLPIRISGRMVDEQASKMVLGNTKASQMGDTLGRFLYSVGADTYEFQAFNFSDDSLVKGNYQVGSMLTEKPYSEKELPSDEDLEEFVDEDEIIDYIPDMDDDDVETF